MTPLAKIGVLVAGAVLAVWAGWYFLREGVSPRAVVPGVIIAVGLLFVVLRGRRPRWDR